MIAKVGPARRAEVGRINQQDRSTLTRNLKIMLREGWIKEVPDRTGKGRLVTASEAGLRLIVAPAPVWSEAQKAQALLGHPGAAAVSDVRNWLLFGASA